MRAKPLLELKGITKKFGPLTANDNINLTVFPGEVHAILGENGAGKSTLMNILYGMYIPDSGFIEINGKKAAIKSPKDALNYGIGMVHQHYKLVDTFSSAENVFLIGEDPWWKIKSNRKIEAQLEKIGKEHGLPVDLKSHIDKLTIGMQQRVEILKLLYRNAKILILDEPTAVLAPQECKVLFDTIKSLVSHGESVLFISHKMDEVFQISDRITVLRKGKVVATVKTKEVNQNDVVRMMIGNGVEIKKPAIRTVNSDCKPFMEIQNVSAIDNRKVQTLGPLSLTVGQGEIVGIAGIEGNGQEELAEVAAGIRSVTEGKIIINGHEVTPGNVRDFTNERISYVPVDRNEVGSVKTFPLFQNWILRKMNLPRCHGLLDYKKILDQTSDAMKEYDVRPTDMYAKTENFSGGNLQKFILAREMMKAPKMIICSYPTRGLDIRATWFIRDRLIKARDKGLGVLLLSGDLDELFFLSDRLLVLFRGQIIGELNPKMTSIEEVGMLMTGVKPA